MAKSPKSAADRRQRPPRRRHYTKSRRVSKVAGCPTRPFFAQTRRFLLSTTVARPRSFAVLRVRRFFCNPTYPLKTPNFNFRALESFQVPVGAKKFLKKTRRRPKNAKLTFTQAGKIVKIALTMKRVAFPLGRVCPFAPYFVDVPNVDAR